MVNATGVWTDDIQELVGGRGQIHVRASKGVHLVVPRDRIHSLTGIILRTEKSVLFVIPWGRHWIIGTTDTQWELDKAHPAASRSDIDYVLDHVNAVLSVPLTRDDVEGVYAGLRPLLSGESEETSKLSREHVVAHPVPGLVMVAGGKYTTYRVMAKDAVDAVAHGLDRRVPAVVHRPDPAGRGARGTRRCGTPGSGWPTRLGLHVATDRAPAAAVRLADRGDPARSIEERPDLGRPADGRGRLPAGGDRLRGQPRGRPAPERRAGPAYAHLDRDLGPRASASRRRPPSCWRRRWAGTTSRSSARSSTTRKRVEAERLSQEQDTDQEADAIRLGAPEIVPWRAPPQSRVPGLGPPGPGP